MSVQLDPRQRELQNEFRTFASEQIAPNAAEFDRLESIPRQFLTDLAARGYLASQVPSEHGGRPTCVRVHQ